MCLAHPAPSQCVLASCSACLNQLLCPAGCYSLARLLDEGVVAGCEGDVCSALGMLWSKLMTGQVPWMANIAQASRILRQSKGVKGCSLHACHLPITAQHHRQLFALHTPSIHWPALPAAPQVDPANGVLKLAHVGPAAVHSVHFAEGRITAALRSVLNCGSAVYLHRPHPHSPLCSARLPEACCRTAHTRSVACLLWLAIHACHPCCVTSATQPWPSAYPAHIISPPMPPSTNNAANHPL